MESVGGRLEKVLCLVEYGGFLNFQNHKFQIPNPQLWKTMTPPLNTCEQVKWSNRKWNKNKNYNYNMNTFRLISLCSFPFFLLISPVFLDNCQLVSEHIFPLKTRNGSMLYSSRQKQKSCEINLTLIFFNNRPTFEFE